LSIPPTSSVLDEILREGARRLLQAVLEAEIQEHLDRHQQVRDAQGHREVVRNGHHPEWVILA
jgi:transposase-like protein